jgi:hypothetical protein
MLAAAAYTRAMLMVMMGLALVVLTALTYAGLTAATDRDDLTRRQTDAWAAALGLVCASLIVFGAKDVQREAATTDVVAAADAAEPAPLVRRRLRLDLRPRAMVPLAESARVVIAATVAPEPETLAPEPLALAEESSPSNVPLLTARGRDEAIAIAIAGPGLLPAATPVAIVAPASVGRSPSERPIAAATATPAPISLARATATALPPLAPIRPELPPPTEVVPAQPTPHCGDPAEIDLNVELLSAEAERDDEGELVVRYDVRLDNRSAFPLQLTSVRVTALNRTGGSEQYGVDARSDLTLPAADALRFSGAVALRKNPGPFGRTEVCISFVPETCGQRLPPNQRIMTRCRSVGGF